jgi:hypothetical protein
MLIDISNISLDVENFRHRKAKTEREAMELLLSDEVTHKVAELAEDIIDRGGLDPSSRLIVTEDQKNPGHYIALEGNRRITAMKSMINPAIAAATPGYSIFKRLNPLFMDLNLTQVDCVVLDRDAAAEWIRRKHYKGMGGKGVVEWNAIATARSDASEGRYTRWMTSLAYLEENGVDAEELRDGISRKTTTVERVLSSSHVGSILGLQYGKNGTVTPENGNIKAAIGLIQALFEAMAEKSFVETKVSSATQQKDFLEKFSHLNVKNKPTPLQANSSGAGPVQGSFSAGPSGGHRNSGSAGGNTSSNPGGSSGSGSQAAGASGGGTTRSRPVKNRNKLADTGLRISNYALNKLYAELKKLNVETSPHIGAAMIRVFLEKSTMVFLTDMAVTCPNPKGWREFDIKLKDKVAAALNVIDPKKTNADLSFARDIANGVRDKQHTLDHLNSAVHDHVALPLPSELVTIWDRLHPYYVEMFKTLEKHGK